MNWIKIFLFSVLMISVYSCENKANKEELIGSVEEAVKLIEDYEGDVRNFKLGLKENLTLEKEPFPLSASMAVITNAMIKKGWTFNGSEKVAGGKIHFYKILE